MSCGARSFTYVHVQMVSITTVRNERKSKRADMARSVRSNPLRPTLAVYARLSRLERWSQLYRGGLCATCALPRFLVRAAARFSLPQLDTRTCRSVHVQPEGEKQVPRLKLPSAHSEFQDASYPSLQRRRAARPSRHSCVVRGRAYRGPRFRHWCGPADSSCISGASARHSICTTSCSPSAKLGLTCTLPRPFCAHPQ